MLDERDRKFLEQIRKVGEEAQPSWRDPKWAYTLIVGGVVFGGVDIAMGEPPGAIAGWLLGFGLGALMIQVPISRVVWRCHRLVRHADEKKAFD